MEELTKKAYQIRRNVIELVYRSGAGHIGGDLSAIDAMTVLYNGIMNVSPQMAKDPNRDRFLLSKAHCADGLFAVLSDRGYFPWNDLVNTFSQFGSKYIGHPNTDVPGVEICGGSLGHGLSVGVGMALAAKMDEKIYRTYVLLGDGEMAEGSNYEAMMCAGHYQLDNLCATVDLNGLQISGKIEDVMNSSVLADKFTAFGWNVLNVSDGNDCLQLLAAYHAAKNVKGKPTVVIAHTVKGKGVSFMENAAKWHHGVMSEEQYQIAVKELEAAIR